MAEQTIGGLVDSAGVTLEMENNDLVSDVLVIAKVIDEDGEVSVAIGASESMDWLTQLGLVEAASGIIRRGATEDP